MQQALLHVPIYDCKNMSLKAFLQDVKNGVAICLQGILSVFFKGLVAKLRDSARDAVSEATINSEESLKNALKTYFSPKKNYVLYTAEIQGVHMGKGKSILEYHSRIKKLIDKAKAPLAHSF